MIYFLSFSESDGIGTNRSILIGDLEKNIASGHFSSLAVSSDPVKSVSSYVDSLIKQADAFSSRSDVSEYHLYQLRSMIYRVITAGLCSVVSLGDGSLEYRCFKTLSHVLDSDTVRLYEDYHRHFSELDLSLKESFSSAVKSKEV